MAYEVDSLDIEISASVGKASQSLNTLVKRLEAVNKQLTGTNATGLPTLARGVDRLSDSMAKISQNTKLTDFTRLGKGLAALASVDSSGFAKLAANISLFSNAMNNFNVGSSTQSVADLVNAFKGFGYKNTEKAIANMPLLSNGLLQMMTTLSRAPRVNQNVIDLANAMANLASQGSKVGSASAGLKRFFNTADSGARSASKSFKSLAYYFGKFYANFWLLRKGFSVFKGAIEYSSDLVEVQNVVDNVFGDMTDDVEEFSQNSIKSFGMSELTAKKVASEFQAMGNAMGISNEAVRQSNGAWSAVNEKLQETGNGYNDVATSMADVSLNLTKLAADMGSFYNQDYEDVGERLASGIFTGQTRVLRQYGLDLTQATLQEFALSQGIEKEVRSMTQAEKTMLRYQYVMQRTENIQGDFQRTQDSWANQTRILTQNLQNLGKTIGMIGTNAFKPFLKALNLGIERLNDFAVAVGNSLGKIFGWEYQVGGGAASNIEDLADSFDDATDSAKKLNKQLRGMDELNNLSSSDSSLSTAGNTALSGYDSGSWNQTEPIWKGYESSLDSLDKLGQYFRDKIIAMFDIDWNSVKEKGKGFASSLAAYLNGLFSGNEDGTSIFDSIATTLAEALNTAVDTAIEFAKDFDWKEFGKNLLGGLGTFLKTLDDDTIIALIGVATLPMFGKKLLGVITKKLSIGTLLLSIASIKIGWDLSKDVEFGDGLTTEGFLKIVGGALATGIGAALLGVVFGAGASTAIQIGLAVAFVITSFDLGFQIGNLLAGTNYTKSDFVQAIKDFLFDEDFGVISGIKEKIEEFDFKEFVIAVYEGFKQGIINAWNNSKLGSLINDVLGLFFGNSSKGNGEVDVNVNATATEKKSFKDLASKVADLVVPNGLKSILKASGSENKSFTSLWDKLTSGNHKSTLNASGKEDSKKSLSDVFKKLTAGNKNSTLFAGGNANAQFNTVYGKLTVGDKNATLNVFAEDKSNGILDVLKSLAGATLKVGMSFLTGGSPLASGGSITDGTGKIKRYANGTSIYGSPSVGTLFWAGEAGPEIVGHAGGKTEVLNESQIAQAVAYGVSSTMATQNELLRQEISLLKEIAAKEGVSDSTLFNSVRRSATDYKNRTGKPAFG